VGMPRFTSAVKTSMASTLALRRERRRVSRMRGGFRRT